MDFDFDDSGSRPGSAFTDSRPGTALTADSRLTYDDSEAYGDVSRPQTVDSRPSTHGGESRPETAESLKSLRFMLPLATG